MASKYLNRLASFGNKKALVDSKGSYTFDHLITSSKYFATTQMIDRLQNRPPTSDKTNQKVAYLT